VFPRKDRKSDGFMLACKYVCAPFTCKIWCNAMKNDNIIMLLLITSPLNASFPIAGKQNG
jgi:hypothetical protein